MTNANKKPASRSLLGVKMFIVAVSLFGTLFGWTVLAAGQLRDTLLGNNAQPSNPALGTSNSSVTNPSVNSPTNTQRQSPSFQQQLPQVNGQFRPNARSRSSR